ncbi:FK506-binding protein 2B [Coemansia erecta]|nr:FK506-binding protein 2B [Coemansia sp. RSA 2618]KAJ2826767.1 FK506-binding protein 2B [Coemansia erecta]
MAAVESKWTAEELAGDGVSKKELATFLQESGSNEFLLKHKLNGKLANVVKTAKKPALVAAYADLFATQQFRSSDEASASDIKQTKPEVVKEAKVEAKTDDIKYYEKVIIKKGTGDRCPAKGDRVSVFYTGKLEDGTVFDDNTEPKGRKPPGVLVFKVGTGRVIRGWDEALMTMVRGETASLTIKPEWAYGQRGNQAGGIPPNATLFFTVQLVDIA